MSGDAHERAVERQAAMWLARTSDPAAGERERAAASAWRAAAPEHEAAMARLERAWSALDVVGRPPADMAAARSRRAVPSLAAAAALIAALALGWLLAPMDGAELARATARGQIDALTLADGSAVTLNGNSAVSARLDRNQRRLELVRGEALFDVRPDPTRRFIIDAGPARVTVIGTRFVVDRLPGGTTVSVLQGKVEVATTNQTRHLLGAGDRLRVATDGRTRLDRPSDPGAAAAWREGRLVFDGEPLADALAALNRHADPQLALADPGLGQTPVYGVFRSHDSAGFARALVASLDIRTEVTDDGRLVLHRGTTP